MRSRSGAAAPSTNARLARMPARWLSIAALLLAAQPARAEGMGAGVVAIVEGNAYVQRGQIFYPNPVAGDSVKLNQFGQYIDTKPAPAYVKWEQNTRRHLKPNDTIEEGEIIQTMGDAWLKVLFKDDSMMDIGPAALVQVERFAGGGPDDKNRSVMFKVLYGRVRGVVAKPLAGPQKYQLLTPSAIMGVRGTEFLVDVVPDDKNRSTTQVVCLHGQVSVDVSKFTAKGEVYTQPIVVNPGSSFTANGTHGLGQEVLVKTLSQSALRSEVARISPAVNTRATLVGASPPPSRLPGTGVRLSFDYAQHTVRKAKTLVASAFDSDHPPVARTLASASDNFRLPRELGADPAAFGNLRDQHYFTGLPPLSLLPASFSRVHVNFVGVP